MVWRRSPPSGTASPIRQRPPRWLSHASSWSVSTILLDTASLYYRAYFALPESMTSPAGQPVNAVRGLLDTIAALMRERQANSVIACWDEDWRPQWRVDLIPSYKTHRLVEAGSSGDASAEETPDTLSPQIDLIAELLPLLGIPIVGSADREADDVIATLAHHVEGGIDIASGDRDLVQLVNERVTLLFTGGSSAARGGRPWIEFTPPVVLERFGVPASAYADLAIMRGDPSDGLPGVPGIGEKTAVALLRAFGTLDGVLGAAADPASGKPMTPAVRARLMGAREDVRRAERVVRLSPDEPLTLHTPSPSADVLQVAEQWGVHVSARRVLEAARSVPNTQ